MTTTLNVTKVVSGSTTIRYEFSKTALAELVSDTRKRGELLFGCESSVSDDTVSVPAKRAGQLVSNGKRVGVEIVANKQKNLSGATVPASKEQKLVAAGFKRVYVTREEYEDGVGTTIGVNYVKAGVWYTPTQAEAEIK